MYACIYIPDFPVEAIVRAEPLLRERAVAVLDGKPPLVRVIAFNEKARRLGMEVGITKLQAAVFAEASFSAVLRQRSPDRETSAHAALLDVAHAFTPRVEDTAPDTLLLDLAGLDRLYGAPAKMAGDLAVHLTAVAIEANIAVAANPDAALHAARGFTGTTIIPVGSEAQRLGVLPVQVALDAFELSSHKKFSSKVSQREMEKLREQMLDTLERWGVRDFRTLALLPEHALASRLGEAGSQLRRLARGEGARTLVLCEPASQFEEAMELESPVETIESLSFVLNRLLEQLCARLEARALAAHELQLRLQLEPRVADEATTTAQELADECQKSSAGGASQASSSVKAQSPVEARALVEARAFRPAKTVPLNAGFSPGHNLFERTLRLPVSMRDPKIFLKLLQLELAAHPPGAPVVKVWIKAEPSPPRTAQRGLFLPVTPEAEKLEITLARISAIVGERRAGIARLLDTYRPQSFQLDRFVAPAGEVGQASSLTMSDHAPLALRIIRPARPLQVGLLDGRPDQLFFEKQSSRTEFRGKVLWSAGPWRSSGDWWVENTKQGSTTAEQPGPWDREEWDIALACTNGNSASSMPEHVVLYRIYRDLATGRWFADASYD
jgi:protein ImuB